MILKVVAHAKHKGVGVGDPHIQYPYVNIMVDFK